MTCAFTSLAPATSSTSRSDGRRKRPIYRRAKPSNFPAWRGPDLSSQPFRVRLRIAILCVLDEEHHQERHNCRSRVDDELPGVGPAEERSRYCPDDDYQDC